jgi:hypothetical protein
MALKKAVTVNTTSTESLIDEVLEATAAQSTIDIVCCLTEDGNRAAKKKAEREAADKAKALEAAKAAAIAKSAAERRKKEREKAAAERARDCDCCGCR